MKKILGGKEKTCPLCGGMMFFLEINCRVVSQCKECGCLTKGKMEEEVKIYEMQVCNENGEGNKVF